MGGCAGPIFGRIVRIVCAVVVALFVGKSWFADYGVLVEGDEVGVFEDGEVCLWKG